MVAKRCYKGNNYYICEKHSFQLSCQRILIPLYDKNLKYVFSRTVIYTKTKTVFSKYLLVEHLEFVIKDPEKI